MLQRWLAIPAQAAAAQTWWRCHIQPRLVAACCHRQAVARALAVLLRGLLVQAARALV